MKYQVTLIDKDKKVINPDTGKRVSKDGAIISRITTYWRNRKRDGDVEIEPVRKQQTRKQTSNREESK